MTEHIKDPIKEHETIIINVCDACQNRYALEEAKQKGMMCCGQPLRQIQERVGVPLGP